MTKRLLLLSGAMSAFALCAGAAIAATDQAAAANTGDAATGVTEIVVVAQKREQSLQKVPVAVSAFTAKQRNLEGITTIQDITNLTPGLTYSSQLDRAV